MDFSDLHAFLNIASLDYVNTRFALKIRNFRNCGSSTSTERKDSPYVVCSPLEVCFPTLNAPGAGVVLHIYSAS